MATNATSPTMWVTGMAAFLNHWFSDYAEARAHLERAGGFLLPYGAQYFVAESAAITHLGLDPDDPDWARIGYDWVRPADAVAFARLREKREIAGERRPGRTGRTTHDRP